jgi:hypothetical protein
MTRGGTQICWSLGENVFFKGRHHFYVDFGQPATNEWVTLNEQPIVDDCCYYDDCRRHWGTVITHYYRIRLLLPDNEGCPVYKSQPVLASGGLSRKDWLRARDIIRREHLQQRKIEGIPGFLLKRKRFGQACRETACLDWDTGEIRNGDCPRCYGTGIEGGYYPGVEYWLTEMQESPRRISVGDPPRGTNQDIAAQFRGVMYPLPETKDVWIDSNDQRYIIDSVRSIADIRGFDLVGNLNLRLAPATSIVYSVPIGGTAPSSSSESSPNGEPASCDASRGLDDHYMEW